jgi:hypothetical protein
MWRRRGIPTGWDMQTHVFHIAHVVQMHVQYPLCIVSLCIEALMDGEILEVDNPDDPSGPSFFQFNTYVAKEKQLHKKLFSYDKTKAKDGGEDKDFSLDHLDFSLNLKERTNTVRAIANDRSRTVASQSSGSGSGSGSAPTQAPAKPLAIEDAKEKDKLMIKVEEAYKGASQLLLKAAKTQAHLPTTGTGKKSKAMVAEAVSAVEAWEPKLKHLAIHGCWPGHSQPPVLAKLSDDLKDFAAAFDDLKQSLEMAAPLLKTKGNKEEKQ